MWFSRPRPEAVVFGYGTVASNPTFFISNLHDHPSNIPSRYRLKKLCVRFADYVAWLDGLPTVDQNSRGPVYWQSPTGVKLPPAPSRYVYSWLHSGDSPIDRAGCLLPRACKDLSRMLQSNRLMSCFKLILPCQVLCKKGDDTVEPLYKQRMWSADAL